MTTDDLLTRAREAAEGYCGTNTIEIETFIDGALWHAAQQPSREQIARALVGEDRWHLFQEWLDGDFGDSECAEGWWAAKAVVALLDGAES